MVNSPIKSFGAFKFGNIAYSQLHILPRKSLLGGGEQNIFSSDLVRNILKNKKTKMGKA